MVLIHPQEGFFGQQNRKQCKNTAAKMVYDERDQIFTQLIPNIRM